MFWESDWTILRLNRKQSYGEICIFPCGVREVVKKKAGRNVLPFFTSISQKCKTLDFGMEDREMS